MIDLKIFDYVTIFLLLFFLINNYATKKQTDQQTKMDRRVLSHIKEAYPELEFEQEKKSPFHSFADVVLIRLGLMDRLVNLLESANSNWKSSQIITFQLLSFLVLLSVIPRLGYNMIFVVVIGIIVAYIPILMLKRTYNKRRKRFSEQLSKAIRTISTAMRVGYSFKQAFQKVADEFPDPVGVEFTKAVKEMNYGVDLSSALENIYYRMPNDDFKVFKSTVLLQRQTGGNLTEIFDILDEVIVGRIKLKQEADTLTSQGRISGYVVTGLPVASFLIVNVINPEYMNLLYTTREGLMMLGGGVVMLGLGWMLIKKIVTVI
jgi:tight adherence protein B